MLDKFKNAFFFQIASYFRFFAKIRLQRWNPEIIVVTGSNGKTTLLHLLEAQIGDQAKYSHHANSAYGISFDILNLHRTTMQIHEWGRLFLQAPMQVFKPLPKQKIYVVEADADRPNEGRFLAELLKPTVTLWVSTARTHSMNFDALVAAGTFKTVEEAIAFEYGYFLQHCNKLAVIDADAVLQTAQSSRTKASLKAISQKEYLNNYKVTTDGTEFTIQNKTFSFNGLLPKELFLSIAMCHEALNVLNLPFDATFSKFQLPAGRGTFFTGIKDTLLIDSTYNGNLSSNTAVLKMFDALPVKKKWVVLGDMKELGEEEQEDHEALAKLLNTLAIDHVILVGKIVKKYTLPLIDKKIRSVAFDVAPDVTEYLLQHSKGGEVILFKGSQSIFLEGIVERLLKDPKDAEKLPRREAHWQEKRQRLGFH